jgi:hypothetical protein
MKEFGSKVVFLLGKQVLVVFIDFVINEEILRCHKDSFLIQQNFSLFQNIISFLVEAVVFYERNN